MSKIDKVTKAIIKLRADGKNPSFVTMSRSFAIALKQEMMPEINKYFVNDRMEVQGVPWAIGDVKGFKVEVTP